MNGQQLLDLMTQILGGEEIDPTYGLALLNVARNDFELSDGRPWSFLKAGSSTLIASSGQNYTTPYAMPSPATPSITAPYLMRYLNEGSITLVGVSNPNNTMTLDEASYENQIASQGGNYFYSDYANRNIYILANLAGQYRINQFFIADFGDITLSTTWVGFPSRFHKMLAFDAVARYRLGTDYDDLAARNAEDNYKAAQMMLKGLMMLDANIQQQQATNRSIGRNPFPAPGAYLYGQNGYGW